TSSFPLLFVLSIPRPPHSTLFPYTTLFRSLPDRAREFSRRAAHRVDADPVEPADEAGVLAPERDLARHAPDDLLRCAGRRHYAVPRVGAEAGITLLGDRRHIGKLRRALAARHGKHADAAA